MRFLIPTLTLDDFDNAFGDHPLFVARAHVLPELTSFIITHLACIYFENVLSSIV